MAVADDLEQDRAALKMINPAPYNAEAPPEALADEITPVALHYVRSNFAVPTHDGSLEVGGAIANPTTLTLDDLRRLPAIERAVTLECAGNGRLATRPLPVGEPWGDYAVSTSRWTGALPARRPRAGAAGGGRRRGSLRRRRPRRVPPRARPAGDEPRRPGLRAFARAGARSRSGSGDPDRLRDERRTADPRPRCPVPADRAPLVRRRLRQVAEANRRSHRAISPASSKPATTSTSGPIVRTSPST